MAAVDVEVVDCPLTERAKKKLRKPERRKKKEESDREEESKQKSQEQRGVIYVGHIPHGFYEEQMRKYFSQFGTVTRFKLSRSKKTGRSRGYAFVEFEFTEVASVAAESMNNYLMFNKLLKCHVVDPSRVHRKMFQSTNLHATEIKTRFRAQKEHNKPRSVAETQKRLLKLLSREKRKRRHLEELGLDYSFPGYQTALGSSRQEATHITFVEKEEEEGEGEGEEEEGEEEEEEGEEEAVAMAESE